jgi:hypothetical protein
MMAETDHVQKTIDLIVAQVQELERQVAEKMRTANDLARIVDRPPLYRHGDNNPLGTSTLPDEYYGRQMPDVIRDILRKRKQANLGAATAAEIYEAMKAGGYHFQTQNDAYAKRGIYGQLAAGEEFHRLPGGQYGLREWYPNAKIDKTPNRKNGKRKRGRSKRISENSGVDLSGTKKNNGNNSERAGKGKVLSALKEVAQSFDGSFTLSNVMVKLTARGSSYKRLSIKGALERLEEEGFLEVVTRGRGPNPNVYRRKNP